MKKIIASILVLLSIFAGGVAVSAPAQAITGSYVNYAGSFSPTTRITTTTTGGTVYFQAYGSTLGNVYKTCPQSGSQRLGYVSPNGSQHTLPYGSCLYPAVTGTYRVYLGN